MMRTGAGPMAFFCAVLLAGAPSAQEKEAKNPLAGDSAAMEQGKALFRGNCAFCHGIDARGGSRGPDLTAGGRVTDAADAALFRTISKGIPGTEMPGSGARDEEIWMMIAFLRSLSASPPEPVRGDAAAGEKLFFGAAACSQCHRVNARGGRLGPDLSRIGGSRPVRHIVESIREAGKEITAGYNTVVVIKNDGGRIEGVRKNEDTFSVQLMDMKENFQLFLKRDVKNVLSERKSLMPDYDAKILVEKDLQDLVAYLARLRGK